MKHTSTPTATLLLVLAVAGCGSQANDAPAGLKEHGPGSHTTAIANKDGGACRRFSNEAVADAFDAASAKPTASAVTPGDNRCTWILTQTPYGKAATLVVEMHDGRHTDFDALRHHTKRAATETGLGDAAFYSPHERTLTVFTDGQIEQLELLLAPSKDRNIERAGKRIREALRIVASS